MKNIVLFFFGLFVSSSLVWGQSDSYYSTINPDNSSFISDIEGRIRSPYTKISYDNYDETNVANFSSRDTTNGQKVFTDVYSGENCVYTPPFAWGSTYSREHTWCQSWFPVASTSNDYYSDQYHLFPVQQNHTNVIRSNHPLGEVVGTPSYTYLECKLGNNSNSKVVFEPRNAHKGDAARALLYMALRYNGLYGNWTFNYLNTTTLPAASEDSESVATLIKWHKQDPPDKWEVDRNNYVQSIQQNRNPLVDHPEYANYINFYDLSKVTVTYATEPTLGPSNLVVSKGSSSVTVSWTNVSSGAQLPSGYILEAYASNNYFIPIDGEVYTNDTLLSSGSALVNVSYGSTQSYTFYNVDTSNTFYFRMYAYNGDGSLRNYKIDTYANSFNLLQPVGSESWGVGSVNKIIWSSLNISNAKLEYSTDGGSSWITIIASTPANTGYYNWTVPSTVSANCKVRISDASASSTNAVSTSSFAIVTSSSYVTLTSPVGSENWQVSSSHAITWTYGSVTDVKLEYSTDSGTNWTTIIASTAASAGSYTWTVPNAVSTTCKVRISDASNAGTNSISASVFSISAIPVVTITSPVGGESWVGNSSHNITWTSTNVTNVKLEYTTDNGSNWITIIASTAASAGSYTWTIPNVASTNSKVKISDVAGSATASTSGSVFTITQIVGTVSLTSPVGSENWNTGSSHSITWTSSNVTNVKLEYTTDNGSNWTTIIASTAASAGTYSWTVPNAPSTNCKVRVSDASNAAINGVSSSVFTITLSTSIAITSPVGGESWTAGSTQSITWTSSNITNVKLEYTTDSGTNWTTIIASTAASAGTYSWTVPNVPSTNCKIRVSDASNSATNAVSAAVFTIASSGYVSPVNFAAGLTYTQNFDSLGTTATASLPFKWKVDKNTTVRTIGTYAAAVSATEQLAGNSISSTASNGIYNFGAGAASSATDRAVGGVSSSSAGKSVNIYANLTNAGSSTITSLTLSYDIEKYRTGTNSAGFSIQMYYSSDGSTWTNAGTDFLTSFSADATTAGYTTAPGVTSSVSNKTLSVSIASGSQIYLAWNYSVTSGSTTSSAQALGLDNVSISGVAAVSAPTTQASAITFSSVQTTQMTTSWTNGNGSGRIVKINTSNSFTTPSDGSTPSASTVYSGSGEQVVANGTGNAITVTGLTASTTYYFRVYEFNGTGSTTKYLSSTSTNNPNSQATNAVVLSNTSDIIANASFTAPVNIDYTQYQEASLTSAALEVAKFDIRDGGGAADADAQATILNTITYSVTNSNSLRSIALFDGTTKLSEVAPAAAITFNGLTLTASDGGSKSFSIRASFLTSVTDNQQFSFTVSSATASSSGSSFATANAGGAVSSTTGNANKIVVTATKLNFVQQPSVVSVNGTMSPAVTVEAVDANNNRDLDYVSSITITASGATLIGTPVSATPVSGLSTFSTLSFSDTSSTVTLSAASNPLTGKTSSAFSVQGQPTYSWIGANYGNWTDAANWSPTRTTPATSDVLQFTSGTSVIVNSVPTQTIGKLLVSNNTTVKLRASVSVTLTIGNSAGVDLDVASGSALNLSSTSAISLTLSTGATGSVAGTMTCDSAAHKILPVDSAALAFQNGAVLTQACTGNIFSNTGNANVAVFLSGSTFVFRTGSNPFALTSPNSRVLFKSGSLYSHESSNAPSLSGRTYANFQLNYGTTLSGTGASSFTCENLSVAAGILNLNITGGISVKGNITVASGTTLTFSPASVGAITFNGSSMQTISNSGTLTFGSNSNVTINNASGVSLASDLKLKGVLTLTNGLLTLGSSNLLLDTNATISGTPTSLNMIVASGTGSLKKVLTTAAPHSFTFPVGDNAGTAEYAPVTYTLNSGTFTSDTIGIRISNVKHSNNNNATDYLARSWTLTCNGVTNPNYSATFSYLPSDVAGTENNLVGGLWNGSVWTNLGAVNTTAHTFTASAQTFFGDYSAGAASGFSGAGYVNVKVIPQGYYNASDYLNATDTMRVFLAAASNPYAVVDSSIIILDSVSFQGTATFSNAVSGNYFLIVMHRACVETWSASTIPFANGSTITYDFTDAQTKAYGDNLVQVSASPVRWAIFGGDVNQDGYVDPIDLSLIDLDSFNYISGVALSTDLNGDHFIDPLDISIADQNSFNYVGVKKPFSAKQSAARKNAQQRFQEKGIREANTVK